MSPMSPRAHDAPVVNHHADHPPFTGVRGMIAAFSMLVGRGPTARLAADQMNVARDDVVVDLGCGPGAATREAAKRGAGAVGVDPAAVMLRVARLVTRSCQPIEWIEGSAEHVPLPDRSATVVWALATVHHWADVPAGLAEVRRLLRPGGRFLVVERAVTAGARGLASHGWSPDQAATFADECRAAGLDRIEVATHHLPRRSAIVVTAATS